MLQHLYSMLWTTIPAVVFILLLAFVKAYVTSTSNMDTSYYESLHVFSFYICYFYAFDSIYSIQKVCPVFYCENIVPSQQPPSENSDNKRKEHTIFVKNHSYMLHSEV